MSTLLLGPLGLSATDWLALFGHFLVLSLLAIGGAMTTAPEMQRFIVGHQGWLSETQFSASIALAQAAPGPNVLFVAVIGFNVGGVAGAMATLVGTLLPSTLLTLYATRWGERRRDARLLRAFRFGLAPLTLGLLLATGWILFEPAAAGDARWGSTMLAATTLAVMLRTRSSPLVPIALGAVAGAMGLAG
jgi:chromate transporter